MTIIALKEQSDILWAEFLNEDDDDWLVYQFNKMMEMMNSILCLLLQ